LRALDATRAQAREQADELLLEVPVLGDLGVQRLLDRWVEQAADTLRALSEAAEERLLELARAGEPGADSLPSRPPEKARRPTSGAGSRRSSG
jgi:hypothetical protein